MVVAVLVFVSAAVITINAVLVDNYNDIALKYFKKPLHFQKCIVKSKFFAGLGILYLQGRGVEKDHKKAFDYFSKVINYHSKSIK